MSEQGFQVITPDFPGFGKSLTPKKPWTVDNYANWFKKFVEQLNISNQFFLLGHSFGGRVLIKFAANHPEKVKALILCSPAGIKPEKTFKSTIIYHLARIGEYLFSQKRLLKFKDGARNNFYQMIRKKDYLQAKGVMKDTIKKVLDEDLLDYLSEIKVKTLIIWGEKDRMVPLKYAHIIKKNIENSSLIILPAVGHSPNLEIPEKLVQEITNFIKSK